MTLVHWDDVEPVRRDHPPMRGTWRMLGEAAGTVGVGLRRIEVDPGFQSTPVHVHGAEEEIFFVLGGVGLSWQDGSTYEVRAGDCIVHVAGTAAHTLRAGDDGLDVLAFGQRVPLEISRLPRAQVAWVDGSWVEVGAGENPFVRESGLPAPDFPPPQPRPANIVALDEAEPDHNRHGDVDSFDRDLGEAAGAVKTKLRHWQVQPGALGVPPHCHSAEEELFVVLEGSGTLLLGDDEHPIGAGHVIACPPATRMAHAFRAGDDGLDYLAFSTREPNDIAYYPRSKKFYLRGVGVMGRIEQLDYWDGEE